MCSCVAEIVEIAAAGKLSAGGDTEVAQGEGKYLLPAFVDPHVHLRSPGQEHKEDLELAPAPPPSVASAR